MDGFEAGDKGHGRLESLRMQNIIQKWKKKCRRKILLEEAIDFIFDDTWEEADHDSSDTESVYSDIEDEFAAGIDPDW